MKTAQCSATGKKGNPIFGIISKGTEEHIAMSLCKFVVAVPWILHAVFVPSSEKGNGRAGKGSKKDKRDMEAME